MASEQHDCGITGCPDVGVTVLTPVGAMWDANGEGIEFWVSGHEVHIEADNSIALDAETRETFQRLFMAAERQAETAP